MGGAMRARWNNLTDKNIECIAVDPTAENCLHDIEDIPAEFKPDVILFAVKPQSLDELAPAYQKYIQSGAAVLSIVAGKTISHFQSLLGSSARIIRTMPNTPASIGKGVTVACPGPSVTAEDKQITDDLLGAVGEVLWIENEDQMNAVTALSGSGPAYLFLLIETMEKAGIALGLAPDMAAKLARLTVTGAASLTEAAPSTAPSQLRQNVTSPGGTTAAALAVLMQDDRMQKLFNEALTAAAQRGKELAG